MYGSTVSYNVQYYTVHLYAVQYCTVPYAAVICNVRTVHSIITWIDIANDRKLWTSLVYELFHDAKNY